MSRTISAIVIGNLHIKSEPNPSINAVGLINHWIFISLLIQSNIFQI